MRSLCFAAATKSSDFAASSIALRASSMRASNDPCRAFAVGVVVYCFTAVRLQVITREDCLLLPKGEKIAKLLKL